MALKYRNGASTPGVTRLWVRDGINTPSVKALWLRDVYFDGVDFVPRTTLLGVFSAPDQTPSAPGLSAGSNYHTTATLAAPTGDAGGWERTTWYPHVFYRNASTLDPVGDFVLAIGVTSDNRAWSAGTYDGVQIQAAYQWETEAGSGTRSAWSSAVTISGGL